MADLSPLDCWQGSRLRDELSNLAPVFHDWALLTRRYCRVSNGEDAPYWYKERPNLSVLGATAWRAGFIALEEYEATRGSGASSRYGRADLWIRTPSAQYVLEAKFHYILPSDPTSGIAGHLAAACEQAHSVRERGSLPIGIVFCCVQMSRDEAENGGVRKVIGSLTQGPANWNLAWCFPPETQLLGIEAPHNTKTAHPGVVAVFQARP